MFLSITLSTLCWFLANTAAKKWCFTLQNESIQLPLLSFCWCFSNLIITPPFAFVYFFYFFICLKDIRHFWQPFIKVESEDYIYLLEVIFEKNLILFYFSLLQEEKRKKKKMYPYFFKWGIILLFFIMVLPLNKHKKILEARK